MNAGVLLSLVLVGFSDTPLRISASSRLLLSAVPFLMCRGDDNGDNVAELVVGGGGGGGVGPPHSPEFGTVIIDQLQKPLITHDCPNENEILN